MFMCPNNFTEMIAHKPKYCSGVTLYRKSPLFIAPVMSHLYTSMHLWYMDLDDNRQSPMDITPMKEIFKEFLFISRY